MVEVKVINPEIQIDKMIIEEIKVKDLEEKQVIIHCHIFAPHQMRIKIWQTAYFIDKSSKHKSMLITADNISYSPQWKIIPMGSNTFTLVFQSM